MSIFEAIKKLREKLTGQPGKGASIVEAINDLTEGLTGDPGKGASIADAISNLAEHSDDISIGGGGGGESEITPTVLYTGDVTLSLQYGAYSSGNISVQSMDELPETITVVWNGVEYSDIAYDTDYYYYGASYDGEAFDFSEYPFAVTIFELDYPNDTMMIYGEDEGTFNVTVSAIISGGESVVMDSLSVTENGSYYPDEGHAYNSVYVDVPDLPNMCAITFVNGTTDLVFSVHGFDENLDPKEYDRVVPNGSRSLYFPSFYSKMSLLTLYINSTSATFPNGLTATVTDSENMSVDSELFYSSDKKYLFICASGVGSSCTVTLANN